MVCWPMVAIFIRVQTMTTADTINHGIQPCQGDMVEVAAVVVATGLRMTNSSSVFGDHTCRNNRVTISDTSADSTSVSE